MTDQESLDAFGLTIAEHSEWRRTREILLLGGQDHPERHAAWKRQGALTALMQQRIFGK